MRHQATSVQTCRSHHNKLQNIITVVMRGDSLETEQQSESKSSSCYCCWPCCNLCSCWVGIPWLLSCILSTEKNYVFTTDLKSTNFDSSFGTSSQRDFHSFMLPMNLGGSCCSDVSPHPSYTNCGCPNGDPNSISVFHRPYAWCHNIGDIFGNNLSQLFLENSVPSPFSIYVIVTFYIICIYMHSWGLM